MLTTIPPNRLTFWRLVLGSIFPITCLALWDVFSLADDLGIAPFASKSLLAILLLLVSMGLLALVLLALTFSPAGKKLFDSLEKLPGISTWLALTFFFVLLSAFPLFYMYSYYGDLLGKQAFIRLFLFFLLSLAGMFVLKLAFPRLEFPSALAFALLLQTAANLFLSYLPSISMYPFAMGWAETSRLYYPSLFLSRLVYGQPFPWPILHPSLHLLLAPPYLIDAPLWFQRAWQVLMRFLLVGLIVPALLSRLKIESRLWRWFAFLWILVYLFTIPLYMHLAVIVFVMLWGYSAKNDRRTWFWLILASIWAGLSRINWYPMPGILAAVLYLLEVPINSKMEDKKIRNNGSHLLSFIFSYLAKPILWIVSGTLIAFATQRAYIALSGVPAALFYTSLSSDKLWYRLWPNASYSLGVLPGILLFILPILLWLMLSRAWKELHLLRQVLLGLGLLGLFVVGVLVSMKIGGGADLHNMDVFSVPLLIIFAYLFTSFHTPESVSRSASSFANPLPPSVSPIQSAARSVSPLSDPLAHPFLRFFPLLLLVIIPSWFGMRVSAGFWQYDPAEAQATLTELQRRVDKSPGEILFISQRHLVSMHMLKGVTLVPQYEREDLMELAMSRNVTALGSGLYADLQAHRFSMIVVDPLHINYLGSNYANGEENNAWTRYIVKPILCNYQQDAVFPSDRIAIYIPQVGEQKCP